jgi:hypothetical protein
VEATNELSMIPDRQTAEHADQNLKVPNGIAKRAVEPQAHAVER